MSEPAADLNAVQAALTEWRQRAADKFFAAGAILSLPAVVLAAMGHGPPLSKAMMVMGYGVYLSLVAGAVLRGVAPLNRVLLALVIMYPYSILGSVASPSGPLMRSLPVALAAVTMVLVGPRAGRITTFLSAAVFLVVPALGRWPALVEFVTDRPGPRAEPLPLVVLQASLMVSVMVPLMFLLERFHTFLLETLSAGQRATADLKREASERAAAYRELENSMQERHRLQRELANAGEEERRRMGQDVHDGVCQQLTGALLRCQALERQVGRGDTPQKREIGAVSSLLEEAIDEAYAVAKGLWPLEPHPGALAPALRELARRTHQAGSTRCDFTSAGDVSVPEPETTRHLYRIAQEAVSNAVRHAQAGRIAIRLAGDEGSLDLCVEDDGVGMPEKARKDGLGLRTMAYRAQALGGTIAITPGASGGTRIACRVPRRCPTDNGAPPAGGRNGA